MEDMNENIIDVEEILVESTSKVKSSFRNNKKLSIFGKSNTDSRRTTEFTLTPNIDEHNEYEKKYNDEILGWYKLVSDAKEEYLRSKESAPDMTIEDLPEKYRKVLKDQMEFVNLQMSMAIDTKFEETYLKFVQSAKTVEARMNFLLEYGKHLAEVASANAADKLFP